MVSKGKRTALYQEHLAVGGRMMPFAGYEMPIQYSSLKEEALAVRRGCGVFDVGHMGEFWVTGRDAIAYVDYLICNDFAGPSIGKAVYSPLLREDGTIIDDLIVYKLQQERVLICVNAANIEKDWNWIQSQSQGFSVQLADHSLNFSLLAVQGPDSRAVLEEGGLSFVQNLAPYGVTEGEWQGEKVIVARTGYTGEDGFEIFSPHVKVVSLWRALIKQEVTPCGLGARDVLRIEAGFPLYGQDIHDELTPYESGLGWTVKLRKKSFIGQDALSGHHPKYSLLKLVLDKGIPRLGYPVLNELGRVVGQVSSGTMSVTLGKGIAMAHVEKSESVGKKFVVSIRNRHYDAYPQTGSFVRKAEKR